MRGRERPIELLKMQQRDSERKSKVNGETESERGREEEEATK